MAIQQLLQSKQGGIPPEMAALIQLREAAKVLKQSASAVTPSGQPTVASQDTQQALAMLLPEPPQQPGMEDLMPGVQQRAGEMAQAQQPVTQAQLRQAMAQQTQQSQQPVMAAEGGIITLPADVQMAEGGIVGFANGGSPEEVEPAEGEKESALRRVLNWLRGKGTVYDPEAPVVPSPRNELAAEVVRESRGKPSPDLAKIGAPPQPRAQARPSASTLVAQPTAQPATSGVIDYADFLNKMMGAQTEGFRKLEELAKLQPKTQEEIDFVKRQEEEVARRRAGLESRRQQYLDLERQREEAGKTTGLQDLAAFLSRVKGRTLAAGLGNAALGMEPIEAERRKEKQAAIDRRQQYFDLLEQQRDAIEDRDVAIRQGQMDRARAAQDRLQDITRSIAALRVQTASQMYGPTIQAGQSAENTRQDIAARKEIAQRRDAALVASALAKGANKPVPGMGIGDLEKLNTMIAAEFAPSRLGSDARRIIASMPNGEQLLRDIDNGNIDLNKEAGRAKAAPIFARAKELYKQSLLGQTKYGAQPMSYSAAASAVGLEDE